MEGPSLISWRSPSVCFCRCRWAQQNPVPPQVPSLDELLMPLRRAGSRRQRRRRRDAAALSRLMAPHHRWRTVRPATVRARRIGFAAPVHRCRPNGGSVSVVFSLDRWRRFCRKSSPPVTELSGDSLSPLGRHRRCRQGKGRGSAERNPLFQGAPAESR
jgi:hypothetical protein